MKKIYRKKQETVRSYDSMRRTTCLNCPAGCGIKVFLKDDHIVDIYGDEEHPVNKGSFCPKGMLSYYHLNNPNRITEPQIRESLSKPFEKVSWEKALVFTAEKLQKIARESGSGSVFINSEEMDPFEYTAAGATFGKHFNTGDTRLSFSKSPLGRNGKAFEMFGMPASRLLMNSQRDWCNSRCILLYGCDLAASDPVTFGPVLDARDRGASLLAIDSKKTITTNKVTYALRAKPGSFSIILKGLINSLLKSGLFDKNFIEEATEGLASVEKSFEKFTPDYVARNCWVSIDDFEKMAAVVRKANPMQIITGDWHSRRYLHDEDLYLCGLLASLKGSIGIPGGGLNVLSANPFLMDDMYANSGKEGFENSIERMPISLENVLLDPQIDMRALITYGNTFSKLRNGNKVKQAIEGLPLIVNLCSYPDETYKNSHVALPMSYWMEYEGLITNSNTRTIQWHNKVVQAPAECKSPLDFWNDLLFICGFAKEVEWIDENACTDPRKAANYFLSNNPLTRSISVERIDPESNPPGGILWPCTDEKDLEFENSRFTKGDIRGSNILFQKNTTYPFSMQRFPSASGKICLSKKIDVSEAVETKEDRKTFPLMLITGVEVDYVEAFGDYVSDRKVNRRPLVVRLHPQLAKVLGVKNGDLVIVENKLGSFSAPAWLQNDMDPHVIWIPEIVDMKYSQKNQDNPLSLFEIGESGSGMKPFAWVTIHKEGLVKKEQTLKIKTFLDRQAE